MLNGRKTGTHLKYSSAIDAQAFRWSGKSGTVEASELDGAPIMFRVWPDSADVGFLMFSPKTGNYRIFTFSFEDRSDDDELLAWHYECYEDPSIQVIIFND